MEERMPEERARLDASHPLMQPLEQAALAGDEDRFTTQVEAVLHEPDGTAVSLLSPWLGTPGGIGRVAAHGLLMLGPAARQALLAAVAGPDTAARIDAAWALGGMPGAETVEALAAVLDEPEAPDALVSAVLGSLAELADKRAVPRLRTLLAEPERRAHLPAVLKALGAMGDRVVVADIAPFLNKPDAEVRLRAAEALVRLLDKRGWPVLFEILRGEDEQGDSMIAALRDLGDLSSALTTFLGDDQYQLRREAAEVLGTFGDAQAVVPLVEATRDINPWVRGAAVYSLGRLGDRRGLRALTAATQDSSGWVRQCALRALGLLGDKRAVKTLEAFMFDRDPEIREAAQEAMMLLQAL
jgi:HEAT repeat protein